VVGCCEHCDEPLGYSAMELVSHMLTHLKTVINCTSLSLSTCIILIQVSLYKNNFPIDINTPTKRNHYHVITFICFLDPPR
jgi:hypothetical protein